MSRYADRRYRDTEYRPALRQQRPSTAREIAGIVRDGVIGALVLFAFLVVASGVAR